MVCYKKKWELISFEEIQKDDITTHVIVDSYTSWKLFSKSLRPEDLKSKIMIEGNQELEKRRSACFFYGIIGKVMRMSKLYHFVETTFESEHNVSY